MYFFILFKKNLDNLDNPDCSWPCMVSRVSEVEGSLGQPSCYSATVPFFSTFKNNLDNLDNPD
jgi:hypothetical protein